MIPVSEVVNFEGERIRNLEVKPGLRMEFYLELRGEALKTGSGA